MLLVSAAIALAEIAGFKAEVSGDRLHVWKDGGPINFSTLITDGMISEMQFKQFIREYGFQ